VEVFPEEPGRPITRTDLPEPSGAFTVVVPATAEADHVSVVRIAPGRPSLAPGGGDDVVELASFPLRDGGDRS
jgi:hypothetical protein